jgi:hypothetical protein
MVNKLVHDAAVTITESDIINNPVYPLVRELAYTYGTQVIHATETSGDRAKLYLAREDGICVGYARYNHEDAYCFRSVVATKERGGRSMDDRHTWHSGKVASLMRSIKKENLIPSGSEKLIQDESKIHNAIVSMVSSYGDTRKSGSLAGNETHEVLEIVFGNRSVHELSTESIEKYKVFLDKYRRVDTIREKRQTEISELFAQPLWAVCYDQAQSFLVGKLSFSVALDNEYHSGVGSTKIDIAQPFKRVHMLDEFPEIMPKMTMLKVHTQQRDGMEYHRDIMPKGLSGWLSDLDIMCYAARSSWDEGILKGDWLIFKE